MNQLRVISGLVLSGLVAGSAMAAASARYTTRHNLFAYIDIPAIAVASEPGVYIAQRNGAKVTISLDASTPHVDDRSMDCPGGQPTYKSDHPNLFAYSCKIGAEVLYSVTKYGKTSRVGASDATEEIGYTIRYPVAQKQYWDPVVAHTTRSLRFGP